MARRRAKFPKRHKNKKQLGAVFSKLLEYEIAQGLAEGKEQSDQIYENKLKEKVNEYKKQIKDEKIAKKSLESCAVEEVSWYADANGDREMKPGNNSRSNIASGPNKIVTSFNYPGNKESVKDQIVNPIAQLRNLSDSKRHIEGFLGGGGSFVSFPKEMTENSLAIEWKTNVANAHKGFVRDPLGTVGSSPIEKCIATNTFNKPIFNNAAEYEEALSKGGAAEKDPCVAFATTRAVQVRSFNADQQQRFIGMVTGTKRKDFFERVTNQADIYSRPNVKIAQGSFLDFVDSNGLNVDGVTYKPEHGDLIYLDPPYLGTEDQYLSPGDKPEDLPKNYVRDYLPKFRALTQEEQDNQCDIGKIPGDKDFKIKDLFAHRKLWEDTAEKYEKMRSDKKGKGIHIAVSHSAEGRFHCLFKSAFEKAINRGEVKACRVKVDRTAGKVFSYFGVGTEDATLPEQEWLMIVSPHAKNINCDDIPLENINASEDARVKKEMVEMIDNRAMCRAEVGEKYLQKKIANMTPEQAATYLFAMTDGKPPPKKASTPEWVLKAKGGKVFEELQNIRCRMVPSDDSACKKPTLQRERNTPYVIAKDGED